MMFVFITRRRLLLCKPVQLLQRAVDSSARYPLIRVTLPQSCGALDLLLYLHTSI
jgi:hypothetical protein